MQELSLSYVAMLQLHQVFLYNTYFTNSLRDFNRIPQIRLLRFFEDNSFLQIMNVASDSL